MARPRYTKPLQLRLEPTMLENIQKCIENSMEDLTVSDFIRDAAQFAIENDKSVYGTYMLQSGEWQSVGLYDNYITAIDALRFQAQGRPIMLAENDKELEKLIA